MQQSTQPQDYREPGTLAQPKMFRRTTGAHALLSSLLTADIVGILIILLIGAILTPTLWWLARAALDLLHSSLPLVLGITVSLVALALGALNATTNKKNAETAWGCSLSSIIIIAAVLIMAKLLQARWLTIPASMIPHPTLEAFRPISPLSVYGVVFAAALVLLTHLVVVADYKKHSAQEKLTYSRAHPDGDAWGIIEAAYQHFRQGLARFKHPPISLLKTPASFYYYTATDADGDPERKLYWRAGELVLPTYLISTEKEFTKILLPYLARLLYDYHHPEIHQVETVLHVMRIARTHPFARLLLWFPLHVANTYEAHWTGLEKERVLERDRFAYECGQGGRLRTQLQLQQARLDKQQQTDTAIPSLSERVDHLRSLLRRDASQVKQLKALLPGTTSGQIPPAPPDPLDEI